MKKSFNNLNDLFSYIETEVQSTMENEVADMVKDKMNLSVHKTVYGAYQPRFYHRREDNGGLSDKDNIYITPIDGGIKITNDTLLDNGRRHHRLRETIEHGCDKMPFQKSFYEDIYDILVAGAFEEALKTGLKKRSFDIE